jgi:transcription-repair coupling factor (superfamily II helicase)
MSEDAFAAEMLRPGDLVVHAQHGIGRLAGLERVDNDETARECLSIEYAAGQKLLVPTDEIATVWRYGSGDSGPALDRLTGDRWAGRRQEVETQVAEAAAALIEHARARAEQHAPRLVPPRAAYTRFVSRFPYSETLDQRRAVDAVLADLASGRPMRRLICGDVGFGKTEVALRAAATVALSGKQVAVIAPTTVLVRQHLETFRQRFAGFDVQVEVLAHSLRTATARAILRGLAKGEVHIAIGTHALASPQVRFADLGLVITDEEQRFGARQKEELAKLQAGVHVLTMTATPIPRTLQLAKAGLLDASIIATPPARRRPIRTFVAPFDDVVVREALLREQMHGGQSFVVCPRIADLEPMRARLSELLPELDIVIAHGRIQTDALDELMVAFARGEHDLLLTTNIIESGLDIPNANTMLVWRPERFGLTDLHQLRGRVGRGRARGSVYFLFDPEAKVTGAARRRLAMLQDKAGLGAGFAIGAHDLDVRGAGDLLGAEQSGHIKLVGTGLYQHMFELALRSLRGEAEDWSPELRLGLAGHVPQEYVPEEENRIDLYRRFAGLRSIGDVLRLEEEVADRFGQPPPPLKQALALAALRLRCREAGIASVDAGPNGVALSFRNGTAGAAALASSPACEEGAYWAGERLILPLPTRSPAERLQAIEQLLARIEGAGENPPSPTPTSRRADQRK